MIAALVAMLTASSAVVALWPLVTGHRGPRVELEVLHPRDVGAAKACRRVVTLKPPRGTVTKGCASHRKNPCVRRRSIFR